MWDSRPRLSSLKPASQVTKGAVGPKEENPTPTLPLPRGGRKMTAGGGCPTTPGASPDEDSAHLLTRPQRSFDHNTDAVCPQQRAHDRHGAGAFEATVLPARRPRWCPRTTCDELHPFHIQPHSGLTAVGSFSGGALRAHSGYSHWSLSGTGEPFRTHQAIREGAGRNLLMQTGVAPAKTRRNARFW